MPSQMYHFISLLPKLFTTNDLSFLAPLPSASSDAFTSLERRTPPSTPAIPLDHLVYVRHLPSMR